MKSILKTSAMVAWSSGLDPLVFDRGASVQVQLSIADIIDEKQEDELIQTIHKALDHQSIVTPTGGRAAAMKSIVASVRECCPQADQVRIVVNPSLEFVDP